MQLIRGKYMKNLHFLKIVKLLVVFLKECAAEGDNNWCGMYFTIVVVIGNLDHSKFCEILMTFQLTLVWRNIQFFHSVYYGGYLMSFDH